MLKRLLVGLITFTCCCSTFAEEVKSSVRQFDLETIEQLGNEMFVKDIVAANSSDVLMAQKLDLSNYKLKGWIVYCYQKTARTLFIGEESGEYVALFEVILSKTARPEFKVLNNKPLTLEQRARFEARQLALKNITKEPGYRYNTVILKNVDGDGYLVYVLAATTDRNLIVVGGHYRFTVSLDGKKVIKKDKLFRSMLTLNMKPDNMPEGTGLAAFAMTSLVAETPLETHVFLNRLHNKTFFVNTADKTRWKIEGGRISKQKDESL